MGRMVSEASVNYLTGYHMSLPKRQIVDPLTPSSPIVSKTLGGSAERLNASTTSPERQETASSVYHIIEGSGHSVIDGKKIEWKRGDTICVPAWCKYQHSAEGSDETVYLYRFDDKPMLEALGFYREAGVDTEKYVSL